MLSHSMCPALIGVLVCAIGRQFLHIYGQYHFFYKVDIDPAGSTYFKY